MGVAKLIAGLTSGSGALLSEAAHSAGDSTTELFLLVAQLRSARPADQAHPFGYGKERYFWSLLAAVSIFTSGTIFSFFEGIHTIVGPNEPVRALGLTIIVLAIAFVFEGTSFVIASRELRTEMRHSRKTLSRLMRDPRDPTVNSVAMEDSAALIGVLIAAAGIGLHALTGARVWDGIASLAIGVVLLAVAIVLGRTCQTLLVGKQADPELLRRIEAALEEQDEVVDVVDILSMQTGIGQVLLCVRVDFVNKLSAGDLEQACVRVADALHSRFDDLDEIFIQPASRHDPAVRERVRQRYGAPLADE